MRRRPARCRWRSRANAEERAALADLSRAISTSLDIKQVCARLSEQIAPFIPFDRIVFSSFGAARRTFTDIYVGGSGLEGSKIGNVFRLSQEQVEWIEVLREPIVSTGDQPHGFLTSLPGHREKFEAGFNSLLFTPVIWNDRLIGTLNLRSREPDAYAARHVEFAERVAAQIAGAIANAGLHEQTLRQSEERSVLSEIGRIISASSNIEENFDLFARLVVRLIPADRISICRVWPESGKYRFDYEWGLRSEPGFARDIHELTGTGTGRVVEMRRATLIDEMQAQAFSAHNYPDRGDPGRRLL